MQACYPPPLPKCPTCGDGMFTTVATTDPFNGFGYRQVCTDAECRKEADTLYHEEKRIENRINRAITRLTDAIRYAEARGKLDEAITKTCALTNELHPPTRYKRTIQ